MRVMIVDRRLQVRGFVRALLRPTRRLHLGQTWRFAGKHRRTAYVTLSGPGRLVAIDDWPVPGLKLNYDA